MLGTLIAMSMIDLSTFAPGPPKSDWLIEATGKADVFRTGHADEIVLSNGLVARTFRLSPNAATVALDNLMTGEQLLRAVKPEAVLVTGEAESTGATGGGVKQPSPPNVSREIKVGGLSGQPNLAFLTPEWLDRMTSPKESLSFVRWEARDIVARLDWKQVRPSSGGKWPPRGKELTLWFEGDGLRVGVHHEMYNGIPLMSKWLTIMNQSKQPVRLEKFTSELIGFVEAESVVDASPIWQSPNVTVVSDYAFGGMATNNANRTVHWVTDKNYTTQVNYELRTPCDLEVRPPIGPNQVIAAGEEFKTFRSFLLVHDGTDRERRGLALRRMYRTIAPWVTENPIMLHLTSTDPKVVFPAIDQAAECGFEMIVISFWSGLDMEDESPANYAKFKGFRDYAKSKGVELGGYSLLASRSIDAVNNVVNPKPAFGASPCLESKWGQEYFRKVEKFFVETGFDLLEHDGSYPGDTCASTEHPGHEGLEDSQWKQYTKIAEFYQRCRAKGIFLNVPDNYFLMGSNKTGMGYRESNWSLPREQQHIHARQNLFDGTWEKSPSMGWMMTPLVEYQGGGPAATIEPLRDHIADYQLHLLNNLGYGAQSCYRGPRIYDAPETREMVQGWIRWFKEHRAILESDVIHVRRADGRKLDAIVHVNPSLKEKAMILVYNPSNQPMTDTFRFPLYYAGLRKSCIVQEGDSEGKAKKEAAAKLDGTTYVKTVTVPPKGCAWIVCR